MFGLKSSVTVLALAMATSAPAWAQTTTETTTETAPTTPAPAATDAPAVAGMDCAAQFKALDADGDNFLSEQEAPREYARSRIDAVTLQETGISQTEFETLCAADQWQANAPEEGAPFEGANSFTEEQARDRALAWNVTDVSALTKDDQGIWRGTGKVDGNNVNVAIDYKGNVVTTPAN